MSYTAANKLPKLEIFAWGIADAPNPVLNAPIESDDTTLIFSAAPKKYDGTIIRGNFLMNCLNEDGYSENMYIPSGTLDYDAQSANFAVGDIVTGGTSGAKAIVVADSDSGTTGTLTLGCVVGTFQNNETITSDNGGSATVDGTLTESISSDGLTASNVVRGVRLEGLDFFTSDSDLAAEHGVNSPVKCVISPVHYQLLFEHLMGNNNIASGGNERIFGDGTDTTFTLKYFDETNGVIGFLRKNASTGQVEWSDDGSSWTYMGQSGNHGTSANIKDHADVHANVSDSPSADDILYYSSGDSAWKNTPTDGTAGPIVKASGFAENKLVVLGSDSKFPTDVIPAISNVDLQEFTSSGTWTKPSAISTVKVIVVGAGGGGAGGAGGAAGTWRNGGTGGGGGAKNERVFDADDLGATVSVTVGTGGSGGAGGSSGAGSAGSAGGYSSFGTLLYAYGGGGGKPGKSPDASSENGAGGGGGGVAGAGSTPTGTNAATGGVPGAGTSETAIAGTGASCDAGDSQGVAEWGGGSGGGNSATSVAAGGSSIHGGGGGGSGGYVSSGNSHGAGADGGASNSYAAGGGGAGGTAGGTAGTNGTAGTTATAGSGGGGGGGNSAGTGGAGGVGGVAGGGGGGGGGGTTTGGAGGDGGDGRVWVISW